MLIKPPTCPKIQLRKYHMIIRYQPMVTWWFMLVVSLLSQESVAKGGIIIIGLTYSKSTTFSVRFIGQTMIDCQKNHPT